VLTLLEAGILPKDVILADAVQGTREISRDQSGGWIVELEDGRTIGALEMQWKFLNLAREHLRGRNEETDWVLESWSFTLDALARNQQALIGGVDWITKKWLLETLMEAEGIGWDDPWLESIDLAYHDIDPAKGLFFSVKAPKAIGEWNNSVRRESAALIPPTNTRAAGRAAAVAALMDSDRPYVINWDSVACDSRDFLLMGNPFHDYRAEIARFLSRANR
jgi:proteasome accessory factor A